MQALYAVAEDPHRLAAGGSPVSQYSRYGNRTQALGPVEGLEKHAKVAVVRSAGRIVYEWRVEIPAGLDPDRAIGFDGAVATVGRLTPVPGGTNVIASAVSLWLDVRHTDSTVTAAVVDAIVADVRAEAAAEGCTVMVQRESMSDRVAFDPGLGLEISGRLDVPVIPTAAGHDAGVFAAHVPTAMLWGRVCEHFYISPEDLSEMLARLGARK